MTAELGMNLAGVERVFELEEQLESMSRKVAALEKRARELGAEVQRLEALRRELRAEIVPYVRGGELVRHSDLQQIKLERAPRAPELRLAPAVAGPRGPTGERRGRVMQRSRREPADTPRNRGAANRA